MNGYKNCLYSRRRALYKDNYDIFFNDNPPPHPPKKTYVAEMYLKLIVTSVKIKYMYPCSDIFCSKGYKSLYNENKGIMSENVFLRVT